MVHKLETYFMNELPPSLRKVAGDLYLKEGLDALVENRLKTVSDAYQAAYSLSEEDWHRVLNALILTRFSTLHLGSHLNCENLNQLNYLVKLTLDMQDEKLDDILVYLEQNASEFLIWYKHLIKMICQQTNM